MFKNPISTKDDVDELLREVFNPNFDYARIKKIRNRITLKRVAQGTVLGAAIIGSSIGALALLVNTDNQTEDED